MADGYSSDSSSSSEGVPEITADALSADTLAALKAHMAKRKSSPEEAEGRTKEKESSLVSEDFGLSQFWYDDDTQRALAREILRVSAGGRIAVVSAPSVMNGLKALGGLKDPERVRILEIDRRFGEVYPKSFVYYDFNDPTNIPQELVASMDYILMDPPYLNHECISKFFKTAKHIARDGLENEGGEALGLGGKTPVMFITSPRNHAFLQREAGLRRTAFRLGFQSKFATPMGVYTNYESKELGGWGLEDPGGDDSEG